MASTMFEPTITLAASSLRPPFKTTEAVSMADSLPALTFNFDDLRARMSSFTQRFDEFIENGRRRVLEEHNQFRMEVARLLESQNQKQRTMAALSQKSLHHSAQLASQAVETEEMETLIKELSGTRDEHAANVSAIKSRIATTKSAVAVRKRAQKEYNEYLAHQASFDRPELDFWETYLGLKIEGTGTEDRIKFIFNECDDKKPSREVWFELDMSGGNGRRLYEVVSTRPKLDSESVGKCLERICSKEDLGGFLKEMRQLFVEQLR